MKVGGKDRGTRKKKRIRKENSLFYCMDAQTYHSSALSIDFWSVKLFGSHFILMN